MSRPRMLFENINSKKNSFVFAGKDESMYMYMIIGVQIN